jgi:cytoskeletal protein RodZ
MTAIGEQLRAARERKGLSLDRVADETNIAKRYLAALEAEDFTVFPGDPYLIGFLRNYAEYLGLPSDEFAAAYKNMKIQEQPVPIQELIPRRGPSPRLVVAAIGGAVVLVAIVLAAVLGHHRPAGEEVATSHRSPIEYRVETATFEKRLYVGDSLLVNYNSQKYKLLVSRIDDAVTIETPVGASRLMLGEEETLDLDRDNNPELKVLVSDLSKKDPAKGAVVRLEYVSAAAALKAGIQSSDTAGSTTAVTDAGQAGSASSNTAVATGQSAGAENTVPATPAPAVAVSGKPVVLFESAKTTYPFVVSVTFRNSCMFRYEVDKRDRDERYYRKGDTVTVNAQNSLRLWASNAQSVKLTVQASGGKSADLDLGGAGEVAVKRIAWTQGESGGWVLSAADVD